jgi:hypothetical protein
MLTAAIRGINSAMRPVDRLGICPQITSHAGPCLARIAERGSVSTYASFRSDLAASSKLTLETSKHLHVSLPHG